MMKFLSPQAALGTLVVLAGFAGTSAHAIGCLSGGAAGAVAGHVAGGHAVIGAAGGCIVGHRLSVKKDREAQANKLIADYDVAPEGSARRAKDVAGIDKLAKQGVTIAKTWEGSHPPLAK